MRWNESEPERRRFPRLMAPIQFRSPRMFGPRSRIHNISLGGVRVYSDKHFKERKRLEIEIFLPSAQSLIATVRVVWVKELPADSEAFYDIGLEFISLPPLATHQLRYVLDRSSNDD